MDITKTNNFSCEGAITTVFRRDIKLPYNNTMLYIIIVNNALRKNHYSNAEYNNNYIIRYYVSYLIYTCRTYIDR